jgi:hypothetical protein
MRPKECLPTRNELDQLKGALPRSARVQCIHTVDKLGCENSPVPFFAARQVCNGGEISSNAACVNDQYR